MADDKRGREKQARDDDRRQRERAILEELERWDETEPPLSDAQLDPVVTDLTAAVDFPASGTAIATAAAEQELSVADTAVETLVPDTETVVFARPRTVRRRLRRPTVATAMRRVTEAAAQAPAAQFDQSQREAYEKTFRALKAIDGDDDDEGITVIANWILDHINEKGTLPGSRDVRRRAARFCRNNGYPVRNDEWLGV